MRQHSGSPGNVQVLSDLSLSILCVLPADPCNGLYSSLGLPLRPPTQGKSRFPNFRSWGLPEAQPGLRGQRAEPGALSGDRPSSTACGSLHGWGAGSRAAHGAGPSHTGSRAEQSIALKETRGLLDVLLRVRTVGLWSGESQEPSGDTFPSPLCPTPSPLHRTCLSAC